MIKLLEYATPVPFVTADQPIINLAAEPKDTTPPERFELFYPLLPMKALLLVESSSEFLPEGAFASEEFVRIRNLRMATDSYRQVFSVSSEQLEAVRNDLQAYNKMLS